MRSTLKRFIIAVFVCSLLLTAPMLLAQDDTDDAQDSPAAETTETSTQDPGLTFLALVLGLGVIIIVGSVMTMSEGFKQPDSTAT